MAHLQSASCVDSRLKKELTIRGMIGRGRSKGARLVQELLRLHRINVVIDGDLGPATGAGIAKFCSSNNLAASETVDQDLIDALAQPLLSAAEPPAKKNILRETVAAAARKHLALHPIEIGGPNAGPWVRLYMSGSQGKDYPWCAGFVTYIVRQAAAVHNMPSPIGRTFSCDVIGMEAKDKPGKFIARISPAEAPAGSIFLVPHGENKNDWVHTGIIVEPEVAGPGAVFCTIEGNTNDEGSREGYEVCQRYRACSAADVVLI